MILKSPVFITSRLLPGVKIGDATISIEYFNWPHPEGRQRYRYYIDLNGYEEAAADLCSGAGGGTLQDGLESLLGFLGAFAEAVAYQKRTGNIAENADLFSIKMADWAIENADEISTLKCMLQEKELILE